MTGSLQTRKTSNGTEYYYVTLSYKDPATEQWKTKSVKTGLPVKNNKRKAQAMIPDIVSKYHYLEEAKVTDTTVNPDILLCDYIDHWLEGKKLEIKKVTYEGYAARVLRIEEYFRPKGYRVKDITPHIIDTYYKWCLRCGKRYQKTGEGKPLSVRSTRSYKSILNAVFDLAVIDGLITRNPTKEVHIHGRKNKDYQEEMLFLTKEEVVDLIHFLEKDNPRMVPIAFIAAYYGLRRSELLGLKWDAVDFEKKQITIRHTVVRVTTIDETDQTKTPAGRRTLALFPVAEDCLRKLKAEQGDNAAFYGNTYQNKDGYVFTWEDGRCYDPNYITRFFSKATKKFGRPEITLHKLRHTCVSLLSEMGWDLKKIQYWCGHKDYNTTANIYMHFNRQRLNDSADDLAELTLACADVFA